MNTLAPLLGIILLAGTASAEGANPPAARTKPTSSQPDGPSAATAWVPTRAGPWNRTLRVARSEDGLRLRPDPKDAIRFASAPTLVQVGRERLLLVFEYYPRKKRRDFGQLGFAVSADRGKTWSEPKPLRVKGFKRRYGLPRGPALAKNNTGRLELYFVCDDDKDRQTLFVARAVEDEHRKGRFRFEIRDRLRLDDKKTRLEDVAVLRIDNQCHIYGTPASDRTKRFHGLVAGKARVRKEDLLEAANVGSAGNALRIGGVFRLYASTPKGVMSASSPDGFSWSRDPGLRLTQASDPAVVRLADGTFLMVYVERSPGDLGDDRLSTDELARISRREDTTPGEPPVPDAAQDDVYTSLDIAGPHATATAAETNGLLDHALEGETVSDPSAGGVENLLFDEATAGQDMKLLVDMLSPIEDESPTDAFGGFESVADIPIPDFNHPVDYRAWYQSCSEPDTVAENAYDDYRAFMPHPDDDPRDKPEWPTLVNQFTTLGYDKPPGPWNPEDHPDWDATTDAAAELRSRFREAAGVETYVRRAAFSENNMDGPFADDDDAKNLLLNLMLPNLSNHRHLIRQTLSDAWRAPDGKPDPRTLLDAFETSLNGARHLDQGDTIIEMLVAISERNLVEANARWALQHDVFSEEQIETALEMFIEKNPSQRDPADWLRGELAFQLDFAQYVYGPIEPGREPALNPKRAGLIARLNDNDAHPTAEQFAEADPEKTVEAFIDHYHEYAEMARKGYPEVTADHLNEMTEGYAETDFVVRQTLPALGRVYQLTHRHEASRRATQLTYAIHLHKKTTGRWPDSLDDLPARYTDQARIDPFTQRDFVYRVTDEGPLLYSASENGRDDGGEHHRRWGDRRTDDDDGDDHVFWPPKWKD